SCRRSSFRSLPCFFLLTIPLSRTSSLFPYTTLFRSRRERRSELSRAVRGWRRPRAFHRTRSARERLQNACDRPVGVGDNVRRRRSEEHTSELQSLTNLVCRLLLEKKKSSTDITLLYV